MLRNTTEIYDELTNDILFRHGSSVVQILKVDGDKLSRDDLIKFTLYFFNALSYVKDRRDIFSNILSHIQFTDAEIINICKKAIHNKDDNELDFEYFWHKKLKTITFFLCQLSEKQPSKNLHEVIKLIFNYFIEGVNSLRNNTTNDAEKQFFLELIQIAKLCRSYAMALDANLTNCINGKNFFQWLKFTPDGIKTIRSTLGNEVEAYYRDFTKFFISPDTFIEFTNQQHLLKLNEDIKINSIYIDIKEESFEQYVLIDQFIKALKILKSPQFIDVELPKFEGLVIDRKGICNFLSVLESAYILDGNFAALKAIYLDIIKIDFAKPIFDENDKEKITNIFGSILDRLNKYEMLTNKKHPQYDDMSSCKENNLAAFYEAFGFDKLNKLGGLTFKFDPNRILKLLDILPKDDIVIHCVCSDHAMTICMQNNDTIFVRDPNGKTIFQFPLDKLDDVSTYIYQVMGECISFDFFSRHHLGEINTLKFIDDEIQLIDISPGQFLNAAPVKGTYDHALFKGSLLFMAESSGHDDVIKLLIKYGAQDDIFNENLALKNANEFVNLILNGEAFTVLEYIFDVNNSNLITSIINIPSNNNITPLEAAILSDQLMVFQELIAFPTIRLTSLNNSDKYYVELAVELKKPDFIVCYLKNVNLDPNDPKELALIQKFSSMDHPKINEELKKYSLETKLDV